MNEPENPCSVVDEGCLAPAGWGVGGSGYIPGERSARGRCVQCGEPVCSNCSSIKRRQGKRVRVCNGCLEN